MSLFGNLDSALKNVRRTARREVRRQSRTSPRDQRVAQQTARAVGRAIGKAAPPKPHKHSTRGLLPGVAAVTRTPAEKKRIKQRRVVRAQNEIRQAFNHPTKQAPMRLLDPLTTHAKKLPALNQKPPDVVFDPHSRSLFHYQEPKGLDVQHNVKRLFLGSTSSKVAALGRLQKMGVITGGTPDQKYFKFLGHISSAAERQAAVDAADGTNGSSGSGGPFGHLFGVGHARHEVQQAVSTGAGAVGAALKMAAQGSRDQTLQKQELLPLPVRHIVQAADKGILTGGQAALGTLGQALDRPVGATESAIGKGLVDVGAIKGQTAEKIRHARGPLQVIQHGRRPQDVSGGDITSGVGLPRQLGIVADVAVDPLMWVGVAALPETGGLSSGLIAERIARVAGRDALRAPEIARAAEKASTTRNYGEYEQALRDLASQHGVSLHALGRTPADLKAIRDIRRLRTNKLIDEALKQQGAQIVRKKGLVRKLRGKPAKESTLTAIGKPGLESVSNIAQTVHEGRIRPGFQIGPALPSGRAFKTLPHMPDLSLRVPIRGDFLLPARKKTLQLLHEHEIDKTMGRIEAEKQHAIEPLLAKQEEARISGNVELHNELTKDIHSIGEKFNQQSAMAAQELADAKPRFQRIQDVVDRRNDKVLQHQVATSGSDFGRMVQQRLMESVMHSIDPVRTLKPEELSASLARIQLHMMAREGAGKPGEALIKPLIKLSPAERTAEANLVKVYRQMLRQGQELGLLEHGVENYVPHIWSFENSSVPDARAFTNEMMKNSVRFGSNSGFTKHRAVQSVFDLADPSRMAVVIQKYSREPITIEQAREVADQLWARGTTRTRIDLNARRMERGTPVPFDEQSREGRYALRVGSNMAPKGQDREVPLFHIQADEEGGNFATLAEGAAERHYGFTRDAFEGLSDQQQKVAKLYSAMKDRERVSEMLRSLKNQGSAEGKSLRSELNQLDDEIKQHDLLVKDLPEAERTKFVSPNAGHIRLLQENQRRLRAEGKDTSKLDRVLNRIQANEKTAGRSDFQLRDKQQLAVTEIPNDLKMSTVINDSGILYFKGKSGKIPPGMPPPRMLHEAGPHDDPFDYTHNLPDMREAHAMPELDPRVSNFYRTHAQGVLAAFRTRWEGIDRVEGRSTREADSGRYVTSDGTEGRAAALKATKWNDDGQPIAWRDQSSGKDYRADELHFPEPTLLANKDKSLFYDPITHQEYTFPVFYERKPQGIGPDRVWPTQAIHYANLELSRAGEYDNVFESGMDAAWQKWMSYMRYGVTTPFPAYHVRNMLSDLLKSLQADSGVMFHPIANIKLLVQAAGRGGEAMVKIPGYGEIKGADFLLLADTIGLRSGHHIAEVYRLMDNGKFTHSHLNSLFFHSKGSVINPISWFVPGSFFGEKIIKVGAGREDWTRFMTFMQRMRANGGDAADASMYMIRHHFNYNDLTSKERRVARNVFLFYTWYRRNIPLQLQEIVRRPGFFAGVAHTYRDLMTGETPLNVDFSKINPILPDLSGEFPVSGVIPDYYRDRLLATGISWNGHAAMFGFGAPWADLQLVSLDGITHEVPAMMNPAITGLVQGIFKKDLLTGRDLKEKETSPIASGLQKILGLAGIELPKDKQKRPILPFWLNLVLNQLPIAGRGSSAAIDIGPFRDQGQAQKLGRRLNWLTGINVFIAPKKGGVREHEALIHQIVGRAHQRDDLAISLSNLKKKERDARLKHFDKQTRGWANKHHIPMFLLKEVRGSGYYVTKAAKKGGGAAGGGLHFGGSGSSKKKGSGGGLHFGGSGSSKGGGGSLHLGGASFTPSGGGGGTGGTSSGGTLSSDDANVIADAAAAHGVSAETLAGVYGTESAFGSNTNNSGVGPNGGAKGPFQFEDATAQSVGLKNPQDFVESADKAAQYLASLGADSNPDSSATKAALNHYSGGGGSDYVAKVKTNGKQLHAARAHAASSSGATSIRGEVVPPSVNVKPDQVDETAAITDALLSHRKPGQSLLHAITSRIDSGAYTTAGSTVVSAGKVPSVDQLTTTSPDTGNAVDRMISVGRAQGKRKLSYLWGGGHGAHPAKIGERVDCSGYVAQILGVTPRTSGEFMHFGAAGPGQTVTIYANARHVLVKVGNHWFSTSHQNPGGGPGEIRRPTSSYLAQFTQRHPKGM